MCEYCQSMPHKTGCPNETPDTIKCVWCKDDVPVGDIKKIGSDWVCSDCEYDYLSDKGDKFVDEYIEENKSEYLLWWWSGFSQEDQIQLISRVYKSFFFHDLNGEERFSSKSEFCLQEDGFLGYVEGRLNEET